MDITFTSTGADLETLTAGAVKALQKANREVGREVGRVARVAVLADVRASRPGGLRFGKRPGRGTRYRLGAKTKVDASATGATVTVSAFPAGFWSISEYGSRAHEIDPRLRRALHFNEMFSAHALHPGTSGHPYWTGAEPALDRAVTEQIAETFDDAMGI